MSDTQVISNNFNNSVGEETGFVSPPYDVDSVAIILKATDNGVLVHEPVTTLNPLSWVNGKEGTGDISRDAVSYYKAEDFLEAYPDKGDAVAIETYQRDYRGIEGVFQSAPTSPVADDAGVMKDRMVEMAVDLKVYEAEFAVQSEVSRNVIITSL